MTHPRIIQGGMGIGVSGWRLANAVSRAGQLGVVSGTALTALFARRLQDGDPGGDLRRALGRFPVPELVRRVLDAYFVPGGIPPQAPYRGVPVFSRTPSRALEELTVAAAFAEVTLAREGHDGPVGINLMEKIQMPNPALLCGAMLAGVTYVLMGAGIPRAIPAILDGLARHEAVTLKLDVAEAKPGDDFRIAFDPARILDGMRPPVTRPQFLPIVASDALAVTLARKSTGRVDGFIVEGPTAGGHNAPPRGAPALNDRGEPVYGPRDAVDLAKLKELGLPFWLAGSYGHPGRLREALAQGAAGIQVGTAFAFCRESGLTEELKRAVIAKARDGDLEIFTDPVASPTGFPFKVVRLEGTLAEPAVYDARPRICDLGFLRQAYRKEDGTPGYRCAGEPVDDFTAKGGNPAETPGRICLCNALLANVGVPQRRHDAPVEAPLLTAGDDVNSIARFVRPGEDAYSANDVLRYLLADMMT